MSASEWRSRWGVGLTFAGAVALALGPQIAAGRFWAAGDGLTQNFPQRIITAIAQCGGELPFWNPYAFAGVPLFATIQPGMLFPGNWPFLVLPPVIAQNVVVAAAVGGACVTTYLFARALALPRLAALLAGIVFGLGGFVTMHVEHVQMAQIAALTPLLLWAVERFAQGGRPLYAAVAALCVAGMVFAGSPQITAYGLLLAGAYALFRGWGLPRGDRPGFFLAGGLIGAVGIGLSACQLLPTLDLIASTQRGSLGPYAFAFASLPPTGLAGLIAPYAFGVRAPAWPFNVPWWGVPDWQGFLDGYVGMVALLLALVALGRIGASRQVRFWACVAGLGTLLALGTYSPLAAVVAQLPVLNSMRYPYRHFFEVTLALALLAGHGLAWLLERGPLDAGLRRRAIATVAGGLVAITLAVVVGAAVAGPGIASRLQAYVPAGIDLAAAFSPWGPGLWLPLVLALATGALAAAVGWRVDASPAGPEGRPRQAVGLVRSVAACALIALAASDLLLYGRLQGLGFVLPLAPAGPLPAPWPDRAAGRELTVPVLRYPNCYDCDVLAHLQRFRYPGVAALAGIAAVNGYDAFLPARYGRLLGMDSFGHAGEFDGSLWEPRHHALDLLGLRTLRLEAALVETPAWQARLAAGRWIRQGARDGFVVLTNPRALPLGWRVARSRVLDAAGVDAGVAGIAGTGAPSAAGSLRLGSPQPFDPRTEALLEAPDGAVGTFAPGPVATRWLDRTRLGLTTSGPGPGLVVVSEGFDAGWTATLTAGEGAPKPLPVWRADALVMAVEVPAGPCEVTLVYRPRRWAMGLAVSAVSALAGCLMLAAWGYRRRRPAGG